MRAASVSALGAIGLQEPSLASHIANVLELFRDDKDEEEVRHRAAHFIRQLTLGARRSAGESAAEAPAQVQEEPLEPGHLDGLIAQLDDMLDAGDCDLQALDFFAAGRGAARKGPKQLTKTERIQQKHQKSERPGAVSGGSAKTGDAEVGAFLKGKLGPEAGDCVFSSAFEKLSEEDFEYFVRARKHVFAELVVVEFLVANNSENAVHRVQIKLGGG